MRRTEVLLPPARRSNLPFEDPKTPDNELPDSNDHPTPIATQVSPTLTLDVRQKEGESSESPNPPLDGVIHLVLLKHSNDFLLHGLRNAGESFSWRFCNCRGSRSSDSMDQLIRCDYRIQSWEIGHICWWLVLQFDVSSSLWGHLGFLSPEYK